MSVVLESTSSKARSQTARSLPIHHLVPVMLRERELQIAFGTIERIRICFCCEVPMWRFNGAAYERESLLDRPMLLFRAGGDKSWVARSWKPILDCCCIHEVYFCGAGRSRGPCNVVGLHNSCRGHWRCCARFDVIFNFVSVTHVPARNVFQLKEPSNCMLWGRTLQRFAPKSDLQSVETSLVVD